MSANKGARDRWVHVKVTEAERVQWQALAESEGVSVADLIRRRVGDARPVGRAPVRRRAARRADPLLLATLGRIGNNLNQIARWANVHKDAADAVQVLAALAAIDNILSSYRPHGAQPHVAAEGGDDAD